MAKKRGAKQAGGAAVASSPAPRAKRPTDETRDAIQAAMNAASPSAQGPSAATKDAIAEIATPRSRSASGEIHVAAEITSSSVATTSGVLALAAPVAPDGAPLLPASDAGSSSIIVRDEARVGSSRPAAPGTTSSANSAKPAGAAATVSAAASTSGAGSSFSQDEEAFFASEISERTLAVERERQEAADRPWWRRWLGLS